MRTGRRSGRSLRHQTGADLEVIAVDDDSPEVRNVLAASARTFLRGRVTRLRVIPADLLDEHQRRSDDMTARLHRRTGVP